MARSLFDVIALPFEKTTELERQVVATFAFGMLFAAGQIRRFSPPEVHALSICCLTDVFLYTSQQAVDFASHLTDVSANEAAQPVRNAIIHRGIDGHHDWSTGNTARLRDNLADVLNRVQAAE
jgi:hypothetical protein